MLRGGYVGAAKEQFSTTSPSVYRPFSPKPQALQNLDRIYKRMLLHVACTDQGISLCSHEAILEQSFFCRHWRSRGSKTLRPRRNTDLSSSNTMRLGCLYLRPATPRALSGAGLWTPALPLPLAQYRWFSKRMEHPTRNNVKNDDVRGIREDSIGRKAPIVRLYEPTYQFTDIASVQPIESLGCDLLHTSRRGRGSTWFENHNIELLCLIVYMHA